MQCSIRFFLKDTATTEIYTLSLHDALPISGHAARHGSVTKPTRLGRPALIPRLGRSEEHTSELQSHVNLVCRLLLEKKKKMMYGIKYLGIECMTFVVDPVRLYFFLFLLVFV